MRFRTVGLVLTLTALLVVTAPTTFRSAAAPDRTAALQANGIDLTRLPLGDNLLSNSPQVGWLWPCRIGGLNIGAFRDGPWINQAAGTYDLTSKLVVDGAVIWSQHDLHVQVQGNSRIITSNDLPDHATGTFPIARRDDAFRYDRNPNQIAAHNLRIELPANPTVAPEPSCVPSAVGILLTGSVLFNALDGPGRDAVAHETQDSCQGHPQISGMYHYHSLTDCIAETAAANEHSTLVGYSLDGFGIYGRQGEGGKILTSADLDECHGHTHQIEWDGKTTVTYHYHATWDFPYTIGCMRGTFRQADMMTISGGPDAGLQGPGGGQPDLAAAAEKLGISEQALRDALGPPPPDLAAAAKKLGISEQALREALQASR
jgi:hypothetical protein